MRVSPACAVINVRSISTAHAMKLLVVQLGLIVVFAKILGHVFQRLRQPRVLGELAAGMLIGPYALGSVPLAIFGGPLFPNLDGQLPVSVELYGFTVVASIILLFLAGLETDVKTFLRFSVVGALVGVGGIIGSVSLGVASSASRSEAVRSSGTASARTSPGSRSAEPMSPRKSVSVCTACTSSWCRSFSA
ncbi:MAG: hypothetical protein EA426_18125 [Spirochaetaceae bacterium]|nr:MAG: hypothetical protein EA426_18125 [Spirochaetaceae bacterium]